MNATINVIDFCDDRAVVITIGEHRVHLHPVACLTDDSIFEGSAISTSVLRLDPPLIPIIWRLYETERPCIDAYFEIAADKVNYPISRRTLDKLLLWDLTDNERVAVEHQKSQFTYIYLIRDNATKLTKIGRTDNPQNRLKQLRKQDTLLPTPNDFHYVRCWEAYSYLEKSLHSQYDHKRIRGEWFDLTEDDLRAIDCSFFDCVKWETNLTPYEEYEMNLLMSGASEVVQ